MIKMHSENGDSQMNIYNNLARVCRIDPNNISHYVVGYKCTPDKTYFKIRTNPGNPVIFNAILAGRKPGFSIRTRGDFENRNDGVVVATSLEVIGIDWVSNPANFSSVLIGTGLNVVDQLNPKEEVLLNLLPKIGTESVAMEAYLSDGDKLMYDPELNPVAQIANMKIVKKGEIKKGRKVSFESTFTKECLSFLD